MTESTNRKFPTWDDYYKNEKIEKMPWYNEKLDFDLEEKLNAMQQLNNRIFHLNILLLNLSSILFKIQIKKSQDLT